MSLRAGGFLKDVTYTGEWFNTVPSELLRYTAQELEELETLCQGQADDLKVDVSIAGIQYRIWLSRCSIADGEPCNNKVTVEVLDRNGYRWKEVAWYPG